MTCCCWLINNDSAIFRFVIWLSGYITQLRKSFPKSIECPSLWWFTTALGLELCLQFDSCCFNFSFTNVCKVAVRARNLVHTNGSVLHMILNFVFKFRFFTVTPSQKDNMADMHGREVCRARGGGHVSPPKIFGG